MKILHVIGSADPTRGGPIEAIRQASLSLGKMGHTIEVVCADPPDSKWLEGFPFKVIALGPAISRYMYTGRLVPWLKDNASQYDCAIINGLWLYPCLAVWLALRNNSLPFFIYTHGLLDPEFKKLFPIKHLKKTIYWKLLFHHVIRDARAVFFTCERERELAQKTFQPFKRKDGIVPYCVGEPPVDTGSQVEAFFSQFPETRGKRLLLFLSRIHEKKGCDLLIDAFANIAGNDESLHLVMAGPGEISWIKKLQQRARKHLLDGRITWTGMLSGELKWGAFRVAEVFVLPSHQENFGIAIVEAMACGVPVLITDKVNIWREIAEDGAGIISNDDRAGVIELLKTWLNIDKIKKKEMRLMAERCFAKRFRSDQAAENLIRVLRANGINA